MIVTGKECIESDNYIARVFELNKKEGNEQNEKIKMGNSTYRE